MKTKKEAQKVGLSVGKKLGQAWRIHIWENLGWHVAWVRGAVNLHYEEHSNRPFWAMVGNPGDMPGDVRLALPFQKGYANPVVAVRVACDYAIDVIQTRWKPIESSVMAIRRTIIGGRVR